MRGQYLSQNQTNCRKNEIYILYRSQNIQVSRLKWDTLYMYV